MEEGAQCPTGGASLDVSLGFYPVSPSLILSYHNDLLCKSCAIFIDGCCCQRFMTGLSDMQSKRVCDILIFAQFIRFCVTNIIVEL